MENLQEGKATSHRPGDDRTHEPAEHGGKNVKTFSSDMAEEDVHTPQQRDQAWTPGEATGPRRDEPMRIEGNMAPPLDRPQGLKDKLQEVQENPSSDAQDASDTMGTPRPRGGLPKTGTGEQDPMSSPGGGSQ